MKDAILNLIRERQDVTFIELCRDIPGFADPGPDGLDLAVPHFGNVILWAGLSREACEAMAELERDGLIDGHLCGLLPYIIDGACLNLPVAKAKRHYKKPRWLPVTWSTTRKDGRAGGLNFMGPSMSSTYTGRKLAF